MSSLFCDVVLSIIDTKYWFGSTNMFKYVIH